MDREFEAEEPYSGILPRAEEFAEFAAEKVRDVAKAGKYCYKICIYWSFRGIFSYNCSCKTFSAHNNGILKAIIILKLMLYYTSKEGKKELLPFPHIKSNFGTLN